MADDSDGEGFYDDPFEDASDGEDFHGDPFGDEEDDDGCLGLCGGPSDEEGDDDSNGEEMCELPCRYDDDDGSDSEDLCGTPRDDDDNGESEEALSDEDEDVQGEEALSDEGDDVQGEEVCDEEGNDGDLVDDPCDEDDEEGDEEAQDLCEDSSSNDGEEGERGVFCVSGFSIDDGTDISDSVQDDSSSEADEERLMPVLLPVPQAFGMVVGAEHTDSDDDTDYDSDDTDYDDYEVHRLPASRAAVESLPEATLSEEEAACDCAVCKEVFESGKSVIWLPCKHYFHGDCIRPWLAIRSTCPVCRYQLPTAESRQGQARQLMVLEPVARHSETQQGGGRDGGDADGATTGTGDERD
ncbi:unnamed protein product [Alopecurus aequalis]